VSLQLTHLDKVYWPKEGITKGELLDYYRQIAPFLLPHLKDRPILLHRFPNGIEEEGFYQKRVDRNFPEWVSSVKVEHEGKTIEYLLIPDLDSLLFAINLGSIDLHPFTSHIKHLDHPDYLVIDLDPENIAFDKVVEAARGVHEVLESAKIPSFCKTSGGRGLHLYIPLGAKYSFDDVKSFALLIAELAHEQLPPFTSLERSPSKRKGKVYIDYLQNNFGQAMVAPYCVRPRPGALVSTPLDWSEVKSGLDPAAFDIKTMLKRVKKRGDLFAGLLGKGIDMLRCLKKLQNRASIR
jgi:bifunctional non-homologous end joining protein LigD